MWAEVLRAAATEADTGTPATVNETVTVDWMFSEKVRVTLQVWVLATVRAVAEAVAVRVPAPLKAQSVLTARFEANFTTSSTLEYAVSAEITMALAASSIAIDGSTWPRLLTTETL